jgi:monoterpene epsilon-lactone hydrolase
MSIQLKIAAMVMRYQMADFYKDLSVEVQRAKMTKYAKAIKLPADVTCEPAKNCPVPAEWITTPMIEQEQVILYLHGGAYYLPYDNPHRDMTARLGRGAQMRTLVIDYRLAPEDPYPAALEDVTVAYQWLLEQGYSPTNIAIAGDSCGGGLALAALLRLRDKGFPFPAAVVCISPWTDLTGNGEFMKSKAKVDFINIPEHMKTNAKRYAGNHDLKDPCISPLYADLTGFPPLLIQAGTRDILLDNSTRLAEQARSAGVDVTLDIWDEMFHVFQLGAGFVPEARKAVENISAFLQRHVGVKN